MKARLNNCCVCRADTEISVEALGVLQTYSWPGNIRELRHSIERAVILSDNEQLAVNDFSGLTQSLASPSGDGGTAHQTLYEIEKATVVNALAQQQGNISKAAKDLGLTRTSLYRRIEKYGL